MPNADYSIDRDEMVGLQTWLQDMGQSFKDVAGGGADGTSQPLTNVNVLSGSPTFKAGVRLHAAAKRLGGQVQTRVDRFVTNTDDLDTKLGVALAKAERVENLNQVEASQFGAVTTRADTPATSDSSEG
ncbi:hypothetical protein BJ973_003896 [Actinoplanes tereljensis]|uniref:Uncharacterized protein n=1 Tax=Paractinoplanes tereljensis TaxID=571912 RepID=A0A919NWG9_9ACTN|nr:hypothetical protein [Actinoplanes tereljensis]GIF25618.1 hypothetical protein Ate02nite_83480 [Actinoplanes tereljensis]